MKRFMLVVLLVALTAMMVACGGSAAVQQVAPTVEAVVQRPDRRGGYRPD
ncbi:MAG TPA: hypothetical protein PLR07_04255 [Promineifilum sp.]|nr:hypothetical protein [Promineifilum sp.]